MENEIETKDVKVLSADGEPGIRAVVERYLSIQGFDVTTACNGVEGLQKFMNMVPYVIVTDYRLPEVDGTGILSTVKKISPLTPVIIISGYTEEEVCEKDLRAQ
jgi:two-component system alkaline phosphatase synthesis response regulator PhoP